jgi:hypothetical protein
MLSELLGMYDNPIFSMLGIKAPSTSTQTGSPIYGGDGWGPDKLMGGGMGGMDAGMFGGGTDMGTLLLLGALLDGGGGAAGPNPLAGLLGSMGGLGESGGCGESSGASDPMAAIGGFSNEGSGEGGIDVNSTSNSNGPGGTNSLLSDAGGEMDGMNMLPSWV